MTPNLQNMRFSQSHHTTNLSDFVLKYTLGPEHRDYSKGLGFYMRIDDDLRKCVVFLGYETNDPDKGNICCIGTGFLFYYNGVAYLTTVKHVANKLGDSPFIVRVNSINGEAKNLYVDNANWFHHPDNNVDISIIEYSLEVRYFDALYLIPEIITTIEERDIYVGDFCYTIGLFRLMYGKMRNLPIVHTGNIAMVPGDEKVPVKNDITGETEYVEAYLIESHSLAGLSGSPVFVRPCSESPLYRNDERGILGSIIPQKNLYLMGIWMGSWNAPPDQILSAEIERGQIVRVSIGMGVVVPISKLIELLEADEVQKSAKLYKNKKQVHAAQLDSVILPSTIINPQHKEDFNTLVTAAAKKKSQDDKT